MRSVAYSLSTYILFLVPAAANSQTVVVDAAPNHIVNSFSPARALGGAIDRLRGGSTKEENEKHTERLLTNPVLKEMLGAGWQTVTYRQNTELMIEAWHWNARGAWSNTAKQEGYFVGSQDPSDEKILHSWAYPLPHRGATLGDGNGWSRLMALNDPALTRISWLSIPPKEDSSIAGIVTTYCLAQTFRGGVVF
jgi:hypothetical protein